MVCVSKRPSFAPTSVVASVAAACDPDSPDITPTSGHVNLKVAPRDHRRQRLAAQHREREHQRDAQRLRIDQDLRLQQHPDRDEEDRDEQRRAHELQPLHQRALLGDGAVQPEAGEERAHDRVDPGRLRQHAADEEGGDAEHEPVRAVRPDAARRTSARRWAARTATRSRARARPSPIPPSCTPMDSRSG